jgi:putative hydrolase of the HAD superfamily
VRRLAELDAVTLDANGTLVEVVDPTPKLERILRDRGIDRPPELIRRAFEEEGVVYAGRAIDAHEPTAFAALQRECADVFLAAAEIETIDAGDFVPLYVGAIEFRSLPGVAETLRHLRRCGLELAVVANFDLTLAERLASLGLDSWFSAVVTPADAGAAKPDPTIFGAALDRLGLSAERALHVGDGAADESGADAAGMHFEWAPLPEAIGRWS